MKQEVRHNQKKPGDFIAGLVFAYCRRRVRKPYRDIGANFPVYLPSLGLLARFGSGPLFADH
jgi:hypothetical protein